MKTLSEWQRQRDLEDQWLANFCEGRGILPQVMRRPNLWWTTPRDQWLPEWDESEMPKGERAGRPSTAPRKAVQTETVEPEHPRAPETPLGISEALRAKLGLKPKETQPPLL